MINLSDGLSDLSRELGESTTNTTSRRVEHYGDAVVAFANEKKWPFLRKKSTDLTTAANTTSYDIPAGMSDARWPGAIDQIYIGTDEDPYLPIDYDKRGDPAYTDGKYFYVDPEFTQITFLTDQTAGQTIAIHYFYIPARTSDTTNGTYPIPDRYRKPIATLAAAFTQWSRYLEAQGNRLFNVYQRQLSGVVDQQNETISKKPKTLVHYLQYLGFRRTYP